MKNESSMHFTRRDIISVLSVVFAALIYSIGMNHFVKAGNLFPGGYAGIARLISAIAEQYFHIDINFSVIYFSLNLITAIIVWRHVGHKFVLYSGLFFTLSSILTAVLPVSKVTGDILLISVFGGLITGFAVGLVLRNNASSGGTDFIAIWMSTVYNRPTWNYIMAGNAVILILAGLLFGWDKALYSIIYQFVSTQVVSTMHKRYKYTRLDIVTNVPDEVCNVIFTKTSHGATKVRCEGGYSHDEHWLLLVTINTYQLSEVIQHIKKADPKAFITICNVERIVGNYHQIPLE